MISTETKPIEPTIKSDLQWLTTPLNSYKDQLIQGAKIEALKDLILVDFSNICHQYNSHAAAIESNEASEIEIDQYLLQYVLSESFKDLIIIHRDVLLQLQIGHHKTIENIASSAALQNLVDESIALLVNAINYVTSTIEKEVKSINKTNTKKIIAAKTRHHLSPWKVYQEQFNILLSQFSQIINTNKKTIKNIEIFNEIRNDTNSIIEKIGLESQVLLEISTNAIAVIKGNENSKEIVSWIEKSLTQISANDAKANVEFTTAIESKINNLESYAIPIGTNEGYLLEKKIDFNKSVKKWMDYNLLPLLSDVWEQNNSINNFIKHSLLNLKSSLNLGKENNNLIHLDTQIEAYKNTKNTLQENIERQNSIVAQIKSLLVKEFLVCNSYNSNEFLDVSIQNSLNQYTVETGNILVTIQKGFKNLIAKFNQSYDKVVLENPQANLEKAANCIAQRMFKEANAHYDTLFLNKKFIGDLFLVTRTQQENKLKDTVAQWNDGFNKSILVLGNNLSGKSTFLENTSDIFADQKILKLSPNDTITIEGRKLKTSNDLKDALNAVKNNSFSQKRILVIDDLELWRDDMFSLLNNTRALINFIESESDNVLVIVSTNPSMCAHLNKRSNFSNAFSTHIDLNKSTLEEICKAVLVRHGATHRTLINSNNEPLSDTQIVAHVTKLCKKYNNNLGEVLQSWTYGTTVTENGSIQYQENATSFPDFFTREEIIILKYTLLYNYSNEKMFKSFIGANYETNFKSGLKRLLNNKVLIRDDNGFLKINPVINYDIYQILKYRDIID